MIDGMPTLVHVRDVGSADERQDVLEEVAAVSLQRQAGSTGAGPRRMSGVFQSERIASMLFAAVEPRLGAVSDWAVSDTLQSLAPPLEHWHFVGVSPLCRIYRYVRGDAFATHRDEERHLEPMLWTALTVMLYVPSDRELVGGETFVGDVRVSPDPWSVLAFAHNSWHHGAEVMSGTKTVVRSDVMIAARREM